MESCNHMYETDELQDTSRKVSSLFRSPPSADGAKHPPGSAGQAFEARAEVNSITPPVLKATQTWAPRGERNLGPSAWARERAVSGGGVSRPQPRTHV